MDLAQRVYKRFGSYRARQVWSRLLSAVQIVIRVESTISWSGTLILSPDGFHLRVRI